MVDQADDGWNMAVIEPQRRCFEGYGRKAASNCFCWRCPRFGGSGEKSDQAALREVREESSDCNPGHKIGGYQVCSFLGQKSSRSFPFFCFVTVG